MATPWFVYLLLCSDDTFYIGITNELEKRVKTHNAHQGAKYTRGRAPVKLVYFERHPDRSSASVREAALKKLSKEEKSQLIGSKNLK